MAPLELSKKRRDVLRLALLGLAWFVMTGGVFSGCNGLFKPATPEPPTSKPIVLRYDSVEATLKTMELGIAAKAQGLNAWLGAFEPSEYRQTFDAKDLAACQCDPPTTWGFTQEQNFYLSLMEVRTGDNYLAEFDSLEFKPDLPPPSPTEAVVYRHYRIFANAPDGNATEVIAIGTVDLTFKEVSGKWLITHWSDGVDSTVTEHPVDPYQLTLGRRRLESMQ
jgi:hypothetical protein